MAFPAQGFGYVFLGRVGMAPGGRNYLVVERPKPGRSLLVEVVDGLDAAGRRQDGDGGGVDLGVALFGVFHWLSVSRLSLRYSVR